MIKRLIITALFLIMLTTSAKAIPEYEASLYIGRKVEVGMVMELKHTIAHITITGVLLNVISGVELFDNMFAGYYMIIELDTIESGKKSCPVPCKKVTYIKEVE
jgi:hypothetical protein